MSGSSKDKAPDFIEPGTIIAGRYRVLRQLGEGGMGSVYLVQHQHTDEQLALKILNATVVKDQIALERFRREARAPARIQSDHVVRITDADVAPELGGVPFLVMEYLRGEDLDKLQMRRGMLPPAEVVLFLRQAARALDKAHSIGIVHRDLKPENLFLTHREDGTPWLKLLDFGIAKLTEAAGELGRHGSATTTGQIFGTPLFMSPEQAKAESTKISARTDVWALGLIAHKLLTGRDIWTATTLTHLIAQIAYEPMPVPSMQGVPFGPAYDAWFARCCSRDMELRYATAGEAVAALAEAVGVREYGLASVSAPSAIPSEPTLAATGDLSISQPVLRQSAGALSRTNLPIKSARGNKSTWIGLGIAVAVFGVGMAAAAVFFRPHRRVATDDPGSAATAVTAAAAPAAPTAVDLGSVDGPTAATATPAEAPEASASASSGKAAAHGGAPRKFPSAAATFKPSLPPPPPADPLGGRL